MQISRKLDATFAAAIALSLIVVIFFTGDPLYLGIWYYCVVFAGTIGLAFAFRTRPLFLSGTSLAVVITLLPYMLINLLASKPEGLIGLGHIFSLPGAGIGIILGVILAKRAQHPAMVLVLALLSVLMGFFLNQLVLCNTVIWCGPLSAKIG